MNSSSGDLAPITLGMMRGAREQGLDITTEAYPYTAGSTRIESAAYDGWKDNPNADFGRLQWEATGERLTAETPRPVMARKGRVQVGADADLTLFDPETVIDRSTYSDGDEPSAGIIHVMVEGRFVVRDGNVVDGVFPGKAIRGTR